MCPKTGEGHRGPVFVNNLLVVVPPLVTFLFFLWGGKRTLCWELLYIIELMIGVRLILLLCLRHGCPIKWGLKPPGNLGSV